MEEQSGFHFRPGQLLSALGPEVSCVFFRTSPSDFAAAAFPYPSPSLTLFLSLSCRYDLDCKSDNLSKHVSCCCFVCCFLTSAAGQRVDVLFFNLSATLGARVQSESRREKKHIRTRLKTVSSGSSVHAPEMCFSGTCTLKLRFGDPPEIS